MNKWKDAKMALGLGLNKCLEAPKTLEDSSSSSSNDARRSYGAPGPPVRPVITAPSSTSDTRSSTSSPKLSSKNKCAICLISIRRGQGQAIFTGECSHSFHFHCITSSVKHGNRICPICRSQWKEVPFTLSSVNPPNEGRSRINLLNWARDDGWTTTACRFPERGTQVSMPVHASEPAVFNDDEALGQQHEALDGSSSVNSNTSWALEVKTYPEVSAVARTASHNNFAVLIHLKAPAYSGNLKKPSENSRAPLDLVTVLDVSGSMTGTKLMLLKRAMGFVIQNLGPFDRLCVIAFSSIARRLFPLCVMTESGKREALQAINSLVANGGTNIADGLRKGVKVVLDRTWKDSVASIILLSDGQDTYTLNPGGDHSRGDYESLLPASIQRNSSSGASISVHAFGFGSDHDAALMHSISEMSGGTYSFIETENVIQDAFAQCIGGLLSVVVKDLKVGVDCIHPGLQITSIKAGSYRINIDPDYRTGIIDVGDLYAEEERDFLIIINIPVGGSGDDVMLLLQVSLLYQDPVTKARISVEEPGEVMIRRPAEGVVQAAVSLEVDRQRNRVHAAEAMAEARVLAERGDLTQAISVLETCRRLLSKTISVKSGDRLGIALCAELLEMQGRMTSRRAYESSGRAYMLSGLSSHMSQRATTRGGSTESGSSVGAYQTPSMADMVSRSQTLVLGTPKRSPQRKKLQQAYSFPGRPGPR